MKKTDIIFAMIIIGIALVCMSTLHFMKKQPAGRVEIVVDGKVYGVYPLTENTEFDIPYEQDGFNHIVISEGTVSVTDADCPDLLCVKQKSISQKGESIICLPHKLSLTIIEGEDATVDSIAK